MISLEFLLTSLMVVVTPGTGVLFTVSTGLSQGRLASVVAAWGCTLGILPHMLATALGLVAAIPAVVIYNVFARSIAGYKAQVADASAQVLLLVSRDLDPQASTAQAERKMVKVG